MRTTGGRSAFPGTLWFKFQNVLFETSGGASLEKMMLCLYKIQKRRGHEAQLSLTDYVAGQLRTINV